MTDRERLYNLVNTVCDYSIKAIDKITELKQENNELKKRIAKLEKPKKKRKFRAMTVSEWCKLTGYLKCEYYWKNYYCLYSKLNGINRADEMVKSLTKLKTVNTY